MNELPQRPKFYLHRLRRFWGGLVVLILLFGWWYLAQRKDLEIELSRWETIAPGYDDTSDRFNLSQTSGSLKFEYRHDELGNLGVKSHSYWDLEMDQSGTGYDTNRWPSGRIVSQAAEFELEFSLPIWILLFLWAILWPLWIRRGDKLEDKRFRTK